MKKLLLLLIIPFLSFGQGLNFKFGASAYTPFENSVSLGWTGLPPFYFENEWRTTKLGLHSGFSYDFPVLNDQIYISPSLSYTVLTSSITMDDVEFGDDYWSHLLLGERTVPLLEYAFLFGLRLTDFNRLCDCNNNMFEEFFIKAGLSYLSVFDGLMGGIYSNGTIYNSDNSPPYEQSAFRGGWGMTNLYSGLLSFEFKLSNRNFIFLDFKVPVLRSNGRKIRDKGISADKYNATHMVFGFGFNLNKK